MASRSILLSSRIRMQALLGRADEIAKLLQTRKETISVAESSAGGLISAALLAIPGASAYFIGGGVVYTRAALLAYTHADESELRAHTPGTEAAALARARVMRKHLSTTWCVSETGVAGPAGSRYGYSPGHACIAVTGPVELARTIETASAERLSNMYAFAGAALQLIQDLLEQKG